MILHIIIYYEGGDEEDIWSDCWFSLARASHTPNNVDKRQTKERLFAQQLSNQMSPRSDLQRKPRSIFSSSYVSSFLLCISNLYILKKNSYFSNCHRFSVRRFSELHPHPIPIMTSRPLLPAPPLPAHQSPNPLPLPAPLPPFFFPHPPPVI